MPTDADFERIKDLIFAGNKVGAIKAYRMTMGVGLAEAKSAVEEMTTELKTTAPERFRSAAGKGCSSAAVFVLSVAGAVGWILTRA
jgi:hypothetical protein